MKPTASISPVSKRDLIAKSNSITLVAAGIAAFLVVFTLASGKTLLSQASYQSKLISEKKKTLQQVKDDLSARDSLVTKYHQFVGTPQNLIGGSPTGDGDRDGDNAKIILDALPSKYDFPALTSSIEKLALSQKLVLTSITGADDEVAQSSQQSSSSPQPIPLPFEVKVTGGYGQLNGYIQLFEHSIRPFQIQKLVVGASETGDLGETITAQTYYQPEKKLELKSKVVQ